LIVEQPWIREIDINPLLVASEGMLALDARIVLHSAELKQERLPRPAIRPYPTKYIDRITLKDGTAALVRPIRPEDEPLVVKFHKQLSEDTVYLRYFQTTSLRYRTSHDRLRRVCFIDYDREMALVALRMVEGSNEVMGIGRLIKLHGRNEGEIAVVIADRYQRLGLGTELSRLLVRIARDERVEKLQATMLPQNAGMQTVFRRLGFILTPEPQAQTLTATLRLT